MKLILKNFRCYENNEFDLGDNGLTMIHGVSGKGKSTLLLAIQFALYGKGTKVIMNNKSNCSVELHFEDIKIYRTKKPNRLLLNNSIENAEAQEIINKRFGNCFGVSSYLDQNSINSFIKMSSTDKVLFMEALVFEGKELEKMKENCRKQISNRNDTLVAVRSQISLLENLISNSPITEKVNFPIKCKQTQQHIVEKNERTKHKNCLTKIKKHNKIIQKLETQLTELKILEARTHDKKQEIKKANEVIENKTKELSNNTYCGDTHIQTLIDKRDKLKKNQKLTELQTKLKADKSLLSHMETDELSQMQNRIEEFTKELWNEYQEDELNELIKEHKDQLKDAEKIELINTQLKNNKSTEKQLEMLKNDITEKTNNKLSMQSMIQRGKRLNCPSCQVSLSLVEDKLCLFDTTPTNSNTEHHEDVSVEDFEKIERELEISTKKYHESLSDYELKTNLKAQINAIEQKYDEIGNCKDIRDDLQYLEDYMSIQTNIQKDILKTKQNLKEKNLSSSYLSFQSSVSNLETMMENLNIKDKRHIQDDNDDNVTLEELDSEIEKHKISKAHKLSIQKDITFYENRSTQISNEIEIMHNKHNSNQDSEHTINNLEDSINAHKQSIETEKILAEQHLENINVIEAYHKHKQYNDEILNKKNTLAGLKEDEIINNKEYCASLRLKDKILEAESISFTNTLNDINTHAQIYIDMFFVDEPMTIQLKGFKETKKNTKAQINTEIYYKEMDCDLSTLSGGELSRVVLAFTLALSEMLNLPVIMLDECTASLDEHMANTVFDSIQENFQNKLVLIIAHQISKALFDTVIELK